jgi:carbamate kinase
MRLVAALGGNALASAAAGASGDPVRAAATAVAELATEHEVVVTHGNGPQIGLLALQSDAPSLDVLGAESEGLIGYQIELALAERLPDRDIATLLTQVEVDVEDPAFVRPSKPIGPRYPLARERELRDRGWSVLRVDDPNGPSLRRVVPSPEPVRIRELNTIRLLLEAGVVVICAGGGGIPVAWSPDGALRGVEAVIDKDLASAELALELGADALLLLTDVPAIWLDWPSPCQRAVAEISPDALREYAFEAGSMAPKVEAACRFVERGGSLAGVGALGSAARILAAEAGTRVRAGAELLLHDPPPLSKRGR